MDRSITLLLARPLRRLGIRRHSRRLPILMYHSISEGPEEDLRPYYRLRTSPARFAEQMQYLADRGYAAMDLENGWKQFQSPKQPDRKMVILTFDDGFRDFHTAALPVLQRHGFSATVFLATGCMDGGSGAFRGQECLSWDLVRQMRRQGFYFGSHTVSHPRLYDLAWPEIRSELAGSKKRMEDVLGEPIVTFSYPYAFPQWDRGFVRAFREAIRDCGYTTVVTTRIGQASAVSDPALLPRLPVNDCDDPALFAAKLHGDYDWLALPQTITKWLKHRRRVEPDGTEMRPSLGV